MRLPQHVSALLGYLVTVAAAASNIRIDPAGEVQTRAIGASIVFTCVAENIGQETDPDLRWENENGENIADVQGRKYIEFGSSRRVLKLYLVDIQGEDAGSYTCKATLEGNRVDKNVELDIFQGISFLHAPTQQHPKIYTDALIECNVAGNPLPQVSFRYGNMKIDNGGRYQTESGGLRISNITQADDGIYVCRAEVEADGRLKDRRIEVTVHIPPKISRPPGDEEGIAGNDVSMYCDATGLPDPKYEFYKDNSEVPLSTNNRITVDRDEGSVHFRPLNKEDEGRYRCKAINDVGNEFGEGFLRVIVPPRITDLLNVTALEGDSATLRCVSEGDPPPQMAFRKLNLNYDYVEGENDGGRIRVQSTGAGVLEMTVNGLSPEDTGNFTCKASNKGGRDDQNATITVAFSPRFEEPGPEEHFNWPGKSRNITCTVLGEPTPFVTWYRGDFRLIDNGTYHLYNMGHTNALQVYVRMDDTLWIFGEYQCRANNDYGEAVKTFTLSQASPPGPPRDITAAETSPTMIVFTVLAPQNDGGMPVYGYRVNYESHTADFRIGEEIRIENLRPSTQYIFRFSARNEVGVGQSEEFSVTTGRVRAPYTIMVNSDRDGRDSYEYTVVWDKPKTGGMPIREYEFKLRRVKVRVDGSVWNIIKPLDSWNVQRVPDTPGSPRKTYLLTGLDPGTYYELQVIASNEMGRSTPQKNPVLFRTLEGPPSPHSARHGTGLSTAAIIGIVIAVFFIFLVIVDISCYFMNECGVLMCICVHLCGKQEGLLKEKAMEEGESPIIAGQVVEETKVAPVNLIGEEDRLKDEDEVEEENKAQLKEEMDAEDGSEKMPLNDETQAVDNLVDQGTELNEDTPMKDAELTPDDKVRTIEDADPQRDVIA